MGKDAVAGWSTAKGTGKEVDRLREEKPFGMILSTETYTVGVCFYHSLDSKYIHGRV